jgi:hypothetical protein
MTQRLLTQRPMFRTWLWLAVTLSASLAFARPVGACPSCAEGREAWAQVWTHDFGLNLFLALVPFIIIGAVSAWASRIGHAETLGPSQRVEEGDRS